MQYFQNTNHVKLLSIYDIEGLILLTDDIINVLKEKSVFYAEDGSQIYYEDTKEFREGLNDSRNHIIERLIYDSSYIVHGEFSITAYELFQKRLLPLKQKILSLYRNGTGFDTFFVADKSIPDDYLLQLFSERIIDLMMTTSTRIKALKRGVVERYLLTGTSGGKEQWIGVYVSKDEIINAYKVFQRDKEQLGKDIILKIYRFTQLNIGEEYRCLQNCSEVSVEGILKDE